MSQLSLSNLVKTAAHAVEGFFHAPAPEVDSKPQLDLSKQGAPDAGFQPGLELSQGPAKLSALGKAKLELIAEYGFGKGAEGGLSKRGPTPFAGFISAARIQALAGTGVPERLPLSEAELNKTSNQKKISDFFKKAGQFGDFSSDVPTPEGKPVKIRYAAFTPPEGVPIRAVLNLNSGRTESMVSKYAETIYELRELIASGVAVIMADHRGQGFSDRLLDDPDKGYVQHFDDYLKDVNKFTQLMQSALGPRLSEDATWTIAGHSMGGGIVTRFLEEYAGHHPYTQGYGLSPMEGVQVLPKSWDVPVVVADPLENVVGDALMLKGATDFAPGKGGYKAGSFEGNTLTGSKARFVQMTNNEERTRAIQLGGPTTGWVHRAIEAGDKIVNDAKKIDIPFMIIRSQDDTIVNTDAQDQLAKAGGFPEQSFHREGLPVGHELLQEKDDVRGAVLDILTEPLIAQLIQSKQA
ncbi:MAG: alpha/beta fold hydrolase [Myxococcota bacterium]